MQAGRPPKPALLKLLQGNPGKRPLKLEEFRPACEIPEIPKHVRRDVVARAEWERITAELARNGMVTAVDRAALTFYCVNWARHCRAEGMAVKHPEDDRWVKMSNKAMDMCRVFLMEFGMTPAARTRVSPSAIQQPEGEQKAGFGAL